MNGISKAAFAQKGGFSRRKGPNSNLDAIALLENMNVCLFVNISLNIR